MVEVASSGGFSIAPTVRGLCARLVSLSVVALGGLAIGSFILLRRRRNQTVEHARVQSVFGRVPCGLAHILPRIDSPRLVRGQPGHLPHRRGRHLSRPRLDHPLVGAVLAEQHDEWAEGRRYLGLDVLARSRLTKINNDTPESEAMTPAALTA